MAILNIVHRFMRDVEQYRAIMEEYQRLEIYVLESLETVGKIYSCSPLKIIY
jgi:hypothetical protein